LTDLISCPFCGCQNSAAALFCKGWGRVLEDGTQPLIKKKVYLDQEDVLITEASAYIHGEAYPISSITAVDKGEKKIDRTEWWLGLILFGIGTILKAIRDDDFLFYLACGSVFIVFGLVLGAILHSSSKNISITFGSQPPGKILMFSPPRMRGKSSRSSTQSTWLCRSGSSRIPAEGAERTRLQGFIEKLTPARCLTASYQSSPNRP